MKKTLDKEKLFMTVLVTVLVGIFVVLFSYGLSSVLAMEGSYPPNVLTEGLTPAPLSKADALEYLNKAVANAIENNPKLDTADNFELDTDTLEVNASDELKATMLYAVDDFDSQLDSNFEAVSTDFGESIASQINIPDIAIEDITDFKCEYIYYQCPSCGEENDEELSECELCGGVNPYQQKYRDEYTVTLTVDKNERTLNGNFNKRSNGEIIALCGDELNGLITVDSFKVDYEELQIIFKVERLTDKLTYLDYSKKMKVNADLTFTEKFSALGAVSTAFVITENNSYTLTWPSLTLSDSELTVEPKGSNNLLATLTCTNPLEHTVEWSSSDESILTVDEEGYFKAGKNAGEATITASFTFNGKTYTDECQVTVKYSVESSKISDKSIKLGVGENEALSVKVSPSNATIQTVKWYSEDESVATVDENGVVTATGAGETVVYSLTDDGYYKSSCEVTVK